METNEIVNEEVVKETAESVAEAAMEELANANSGSAMRTVAGFGIGVLAGVIICEVVVPKIKAKFRARKVVSVQPDSFIVEEETPESEKERPSDTNEAESSEETSEK